MIGTDPLELKFNLVAIGVSRSTDWIFLASGKGAKT